MAPTLLIILLAACALPIGFRLGQSFWARARSVQRHRQALDTLAGITKTGDAPVGTEAGAVEGHLAAHDRPDGQAHVRLIGPGAQALGQGELPPPRPFGRASQHGASPLKRPSRSSPSAAALDAVATAAWAGRDRGARVVRTGWRSPAGRQDATLPGRPLPSVGGEAPSGDLPTRPVPVIRPHVYYFDDLSPKPSPTGTQAREQAGARGGDNAPALGTGTGTGAGTGTHLFTPPPPPRALSEPAPAPNAAGPAAAANTSNLEPTEASRASGGAAANRPGKPRASRLWWAAAAAAVAVLAAVAVGLATYKPSGRSTAQQPPQSVSSPRQHHTGERSHSGSGPQTVPTSQRTTPTTATPSKPAELLSAGAGTATYQLRSRSALVVVKASGPCWIEVRVGSALGQVVYEGTLEQGMTAHVTGPAWIRLGDPPYVTVMVDGTPMKVPGSTVAAPMDLQFTLG